MWTTAHIVVSDTRNCSLWGGTTVIHGKRRKCGITWDHLKAPKQVNWLVNLMNWLFPLYSAWPLIEMLSASPLTISSFFCWAPHLFLKPFRSFFSNSLSLTHSARCKTGLVHWISTYFYASGYSHVETYWGSILLLCEIVVSMFRFFLLSQYLNILAKSQFCNK